MNHKYLPIFLLTASINFANAALVATGESVAEVDTDDFAIGDTFTPSSTDLAQDGSPALLSSELTIPDAFGEPTSNLGSGALNATNGEARGLFFSQSFRGGQLPSTLTLTFDTVLNPLGYEIEEIVTYAGWIVNGSALGNQQYLLEYSVIDDEDFVSCGVQTFTPFDDDDPEVAGVTELTLTDTTGVIATGVDAIRITFQDHGFSNVSGGIDGTVYQEIDIIGTPVGDPVELGDIWFVGDSITQSNADGDGNSSPRNSLLNIFFNQGVSFTYTGHFTANTDGLPSTGSTPATNLYEFHSGISGSVIGNDLGGRVGMTANLESGIDFWNTGRLDTVKPELILIKLGTNDIDQDFEITTAPARLSNLVDEILTLPSVGEPTFFISTIAPSRRSEQATAGVIAFNAALPDLVAAQQLAGRDVFLVDNFTPLNDDFDNLMRSDNLHPNAAGNDVMAQQWYDAIMRRFDPEPGTDFADWQFENFGSTIALSAGQGLDPDGDSVTNFSEFVFGGDPNIADGPLGGVPVFNGLSLQFSRREASAAGLVYTLQESVTLQESDWVDVTDASVSVLSTEGAFESVEFTRPGGLIREVPRTFYRLLATEAP